MTSLHPFAPETSTMRLYRIIVWTTSSLQPGGGTYWEREVAYCGYDRAEALRVYHTNRPLDYGYGYGNRARKTVRQNKTVNV